jgi:putative transposase
LKEDPFEIRLLIKGGMNMSEFFIRKNNRLAHYDYSQPGYYFITICAQDRKEIFGVIQNDQIILNKFGKIVENSWLQIRGHFKNIELDRYVIMPNHIHGIINICRGLIHQTRNNQTRNNQTDNNPNNKQNNILTGMINHAPTNWMLTKNNKITLGKIIRHFKAYTARMIHDATMNNFKWQRSFYDHIIRNDESLNIIRQYIANNPKTWHNDIENTNSIGNNGRSKP